MQVLLEKVLKTIVFVLLAENVVEFSFSSFTRIYFFFVVDEIVLIWDWKAYFLFQKLVKIIWFFPTYLTFWLSPNFDSVFLCLIHYAKLFLIINVFRTFVIRYLRVPSYFSFVSRNVAHNLLDCATRLESFWENFLFSYFRCSQTIC